MKWSNGLVPGAASGSNRPRSYRDAMAIPTADASPWPSGPVVISTPVVWRNSGCPGVFDPQVRSASMSASCSPNPPRDSRMAGVRRQAHRRTGMAIADLVHRVRRQHPYGVHRGRIHLGPVVGVMGPGKHGDVFECGHEAHSLICRAWQSASVNTLVREAGPPHGALRTIRVPFTRTDPAVTAAPPSGLPSPVVEAAPSGDPRSICVSIREGAALGDGSPAQR